jgi:hypothetical protein
LLLRFSGGFGVIFPVIGVFDAIETFVGDPD